MTCGDYVDFIAAGGYQTPELWLSDGWATVQARGWTAPLYWEQGDDGWQVFTLGGLRALDSATPVSHLSFYEADAYARFAGRRLPTEFEWEAAARTIAAPAGGNFWTRAGSNPNPPGPAPASSNCSAMSGSGPPAPTCPTRATGRPRARSASTTANSCPARWCCAAVAA